MHAYLAFDGAIEVRDRFGRLVDDVVPPAAVLVRQPPRPLIEADRGSRGDKEPDPDEVGHQAPPQLRPAARSSTVSKF